MSKTTKSEAPSDPVAAPIADAVAPPVAEVAPEPTLPLHVDGKEQYTPPIPATETSVELGAGLTQVNYL
jgi:hypothetical protein